MKTVKKQLHFGGTERIESIQSFLRKIQMEHSGTLMFYLFSSDSCRTICGLLSEVDLLRFFVRWNLNLDGAPNGKMVSNVIGWNHKMVKGCRGKRHLMLLKMMQSLGISHDEMLYVGNDKEVVDHLHDIGLCKTYLVETKGLTVDGMDEIKRKFF